MTQEEILKNNELIAEFLGLKRTNIKDLWGTDEYLLNNPNSTLPCSIPATEFLYFDESWDWLIPVIEETRDKILNPRLHIQLNDALLELDIEKVYNIVIALIKYNSKNL